ncbi:MAG: copper homeostasis protein CutC [Planctomycetota bacterium]
MPANATFTVEVAVDSVAGAEAAAAAGAHRLELCQGLELGGLTPSRGLVDAVLAAVKVPVVAMVRPRPGDFLYDRGEFAAMLRDVDHLRAAGVAGIVAGVLDAEGRIDAARLRELQARAGELPFTCHRAFDLCADALATIDTLCGLGTARVLTSGQAATALAGAATIRACVERARGRLIVMAGAGIRDTNVRELVAATGVREVHLSASTTRASAMTFRRAGVPMGSAPPADEHTLRATDGALLARVVANLRGCDRQA